MNFDLICRVCLKEGEMKPIFEAQKTAGDQPVYCSEMLNVCTANKVAPLDGYPAQICKHCFSKLWSAYKFYRLCETSYEHLTKYILENKQTVEDIKTEISDDCPLTDFINRNIVANISEDKEDVDNAYIKPEEQMDNDDKSDVDFHDEYLTAHYDDDDPNSNVFNDNENSSEKTISKKSKQKKNSGKKSKYVAKHIKKHRCSECSRRFRNRLSCLKHEDQHLLSDNPAMEKHERFECAQCPAKFHFKEILSKHMKDCIVRNKHSSNREEIPCPHCPKMFKNKLCLLKHVNLHLGIKTDSIDTYVCTYCSKVMRDKAMLTKHEASHLGLKTYYCETCKKSYRSEADHKAYCTLDSKFKCEQCSKCFKTKSRLITHIKTHNVDRKKYVCEHEGCSKVFMSLAGFLRHEKLHTGAKAMCHLCSKEFNDKYLLQMHVNRHNNERKYPCSYCEKRFFSSGAKLEHERRHTNTRPFPCTQCDKRFVSSTNLKRHTLWHEKNFNEQCRFCDKRFLVRGNRQTHEAIMHGVTKVIDESKYYCQQRFKATRIPKVSINTN